MFGRSFGVLVVLAVCLSAISLGATYGGGNGTAENPYQIWTAEQMNTIGLNSADWNKHFNLMADIDMSAFTGTPYNIIGNNTNRFSGVFNGNDHIIRNLTYTTTAVVDYVGLFGVISGATIENLGIVNVSISTGGEYVGGLVGHFYGTIRSCYVRGSVKGGSYVGGLVGTIGSGTVSDCYSEGTVNGFSNSQDIGGFAGYNQNGNVNRCYSTADVSGTKSIGGFLGGSYSGGIFACFSAGSVSGTKSIGGLVGNNSSIFISNSYSTSPVNGSADSSYVGGLVGYSTGYIGKCYSAGYVQGASSVGGLAGYSFTLLENCFWDKDTSGQTYSAGGTGVKGKTTFEMKTISTFILAGWDFANESGNGTCDYWQMSEGCYPEFTFFQGNIPQKLPGSGTLEDPFIVADAKDLGTVWYRDSACYALAGNIDLAGITWSTPVIPLFNGVFDGREFCVYHLSMNGESIMGLFGQQEGQVRNVGIENGFISNSNKSEYLGGLAGRNSGDIRNCYSINMVFEVPSTTSVGGLTGYNDGRISQCFSSATISGSSRIGGFIGINDGTIIGCHSTVTIKGSTLVGDYPYYVGSYCVGGFAGLNNGAISSCYSAGSIESSWSRQYVGGFAGENGNGLIQESYSNCNVRGNYAGGFVGYNNCVSNTRTCGIFDCYATGSVSGTSYIGGLVGYNNGQYGVIQNCYSTGSVNATSTAGGLVGSNNGGSITSSFWDIDTSGQVSSSGGAGKTTDEMKTLLTFTSAGWDFCPIMIDGDYQNWILNDEEAGYPQLKMQFSPEYHGGSGKINDPYRIADSDDILALADARWSWDNSYVLIDDVDMKGMAFTTAIIASDTDSGVDGFQGWAFSGQFDGNGHKISNFTINSGSNDYIGLFGQIQTGGLIKNLGIDNFIIQGKYNSYYLGALVGWNSSGVIDNCYSNGTVIGYQYIGGLVGHNSLGSMLFCCSTSSVTGFLSDSRYVGSLTGRNSGLIENSFATGNINGTGSCYGGIAGANSGTISTCFNNGAIAGKESVGGVVGRNENLGIILDCFNHGTISGTDYSIGGLVGKNLGYIRQCYSTGAVSGKSTAGGLVGSAVEIVKGITYSSFWDTQSSGCQSSAGGEGKITAQMQDINTFLDAGWDIINIWGGIPNHYPQLMWNIDNNRPETPVILSPSEGQREVNRGSLLRASEFVDSDNDSHINSQWQVDREGTFSNPLWDSGQNCLGDDQVIIPLGYLSHNTLYYCRVRYMDSRAMWSDWSSPVSFITKPPYGGGNGSLAEPYQIWTAEQLNDISLYPADWGKSFRIMADIDLAGQIYTAAIIAPNTSSNNIFQGTVFSGIFDGNGHTIAHVTIKGDGESYLGLFGQIGELGEILNLGLENVSVNSDSKSYYVGGLAGNNWGTIKRCYSTGTVNGYCDVGGLVGRQEAGTILNSYGICDVKASTSDSYRNPSAGAGGLVGGQYSGTVINCYAAGKVSGKICAGGLIGYGKGFTLNSFWDVQSSEISCSGGGKGRTSEQMKQISNYVGWNHDGAVWTLNEGIDYPRLSWQYDGGTALPIHTISDFIPGNGTPADPYQISTAQQLNSIGLFFSCWDKVFSLDADIDMSEITGADFNPIGCLGKPFSGIFDGKGHAITNLLYQTVGYASNIALFGYISNATITNLGIENANISSKGSCLSVLAAIQSGGIVDNCHSTGSIDASVFGYYAGGLVAYQESGLICNCYSSCSVITSCKGGSCAGGLVGQSAGSIHNSYASGNIKTSSSASSSNSLVYSCAGGLAGNCSGTIHNCYAAGGVAAFSTGAFSAIAGGLAGWCYGTITNSYAEGSVNVSTELLCREGGFVGSQSGISSRIERCYFSGTTRGSNGFLGALESGTVTACFWDQQISGCTTSAGGVGVQGKTTAEMQMLSTFSSAGWDFSGEAGNGVNDYWRMCVDGVNYPRLSWEYAQNGDFACGDGTDLVDLQILAEHWLFNKETDPVNFSYACDANGDEVIDMADFEVLAGYWMEGN